MAVKINKGHSLASLSLTPLIDVVFLLNIFFLVATQFAEEDYELDVLLPSASEAQPLTVEPKELFINIDQHGEYFVQGRSMTRQEVEEVLRQAVANNPVNQSVVIRADRRVPFDSVVAIMNLCNRTGVRRNYSVTTLRRVTWLPRMAKHATSSEKPNRRASNASMTSCGRWSWRWSCSVDSWPDRSWRTCGWTIRAGMPTPGPG